MNRVKSITRRKLPAKLIEKMIVRKPMLGLHKMHPKTATKWNQFLKEPQPLTYKLQELPSPDFTREKPLGT